MKLAAFPLWLTFKCLSKCVWKPQHKMNPWCSSWCPAVHSFTLCEAGQVLWHHMFANPSRIKMSPQSFCQLVPRGSFPFVPARLLQFEEKPSAFVSVGCLWAEVCPGHVWLLCHTVVLSSKSSVQSGLSKQRTDLRRPTSRQRPIPLLKLLSTASDSLFYSQTLDSCQSCVWLS